MCVVLRVVCVVCVVALFVWYRSDEEAVRAKEVEAEKAEADYRRLVATGKGKLEFGIAEGDLWTYFCMARLCAGTAPDVRQSYFVVGWP